MTERKKLRRVSDLFTKRGGGPVPEEIRDDPDARARWTALDDLRTRAQQDLEVVEESAAARAHAEQRLIEHLEHLGRPSSPRGSGWGWVALATVVVLALAVFRFVSSVAPVPALVSRLAWHEASADAVFEHRLVHASDRDHRVDETIHVRRGRLSLQVTPLQPGERFRVQAPDAEIAVIGTRFEVRIASDRLTAVQVDEGRVVVRREGQSPFVLAAGEQWALSTRHRAVDEPQNAPTIKPPSTLRPAAPPTALPSRPSPAPPPETAPKPATPPPQPTPADKLAQAMTAFQAGRYIEAQQQLHPLANSTVAEESEYWRGLALVKAGRQDDAERVLRAYVDRFRHGARWPEASLRLAIIEAQSGRSASARARLRTLSHHARPEIAKAATVWLQSLKE